MQLTRTNVFALVAIATVIAACTASEFDNGSSSGGFIGGGSTGGVSGSGGSTTGSIPGSSGVERCPADPPTGTYCSAGATSGVECGYGPDTRDTQCNELYTCDGVRWQHSTPDCASDCPKTFGEIPQGDACPDSKVACSYEEGTCGCVASGTSPTDAGVSDAAAPDAGDGGKDGGTKYPPTPGTWKCVPPPTTPGCPSARPIPTPSSCVKSVTCDYGTCVLGRPLTYECQQGFWRKYSSTSAEPCP